MNTKKFSGKTAIVTGAGQGIGLEICSCLMEQGAFVVLNDIDESLAEEAVRKLYSISGSCIACAGDSGSLPVIEKMVAAAVEATGHLDIIIANAGITLFGDFFTYPAADFYNVINTNLGGTFFLAQAAANQMISQQRGGSMLFMSSVTGHQAHKNLAAYGMTKAAIEMLAKNLVAEVSAHRINVNTVAPGATLTERTTGDASYENTWSTITPMGRAATVSDIAAAALFLVSDEARHITGQSLVVDGGWTSVSPSPY